MVLFKLFWLNIFPLPAVASDFEAGGRLCWNTVSLSAPEPPCILNEVILAGGWSLQSHRLELAFTAALFS